MASQSSTGYGCPPERASDGNTNSTYGGGSISHTETEKNPWWSIDLGSDKSIGQIKIFNRGDCCGERLSNAIVEVLNSQGTTVGSSRIATVDTGSIDEFIAGESCTLSAGMHSFELTYREGGVPAMKLLYEGPGITRQEIPASAYFREER